MPRLRARQDHVRRQQRARVVARGERGGERRDEELLPRPVGRRRAHGTEPSAGRGQKQGDPRRRHAEHRARLGVVEPEHVAQQEHRALLAGQPLQGGDEREPQRGGRRMPRMAAGRGARLRADQRLGIGLHAHRPLQTPGRPGTHRSSTVPSMALFVFVHGGGDVGATYDLVSDELRALGHDAVAPDLPAEDPEAGLEDYAAVVADAAGDRDDVIVVGHSLGGFAATLAAARMAPQALVLLSAMIPAPGEPPGEWWAATGYGDVVEEAADPYFHDVPAELAERAGALERGQEAKPMEEPWPLDAWPDVPTRYPPAARRPLLPAALHAPGGP